MDEGDEADKTDETTEELTGQQEEHLQDLPPGPQEEESVHADVTPNTPASPTRSPPRSRSRSEPGTPQHQRSRILFAFPEAFPDKESLFFNGVINHHCFSHRINI